MIAIGLMSGSSLDGVDLVEVEFINNEGWHFKILNAESIDYSPEWRQRLSDAFHYDTPQLQELDKEYGRFLGELTASFIHRHDSHPDMIASHGHTIFHRPEEHYTLQIGDGAQIAELTGVTTVCDFRTEDVLKGGQGAPLVPIGDKLLFSDYPICLNIGGIANVSFDVDSRRIAYDICIANQLLNYIANKNGKAYDNEGMMAREGSVDMTLLNILNDNVFYDKPFPKSLGREFFETFQKVVIDDNTLSINDLQATSTEHIAMQIGRATNVVPSTKMLITGGGAKNKFLVERIRNYCHHELLIPSNEIIDFKEALVFAFLGVLRLRGECNVLCSVTGATSDSSSGKIFFGQNISK